MRSTELWLDVPLMHRATFFQGGDGIAAKHARQAGQPLGR